MLGIRVTKGKGHGLKIPPPASRALFLSVPFYPPSLSVPAFGCSSFVGGKPETRRGGSFAKELNSEIELYVPFWVFKNKQKKFGWRFGKAGRQARPFAMRSCKSTQQPVAAGSGSKSCR